MHLFFANPPIFGDIPAWLGLIWQFFSFDPYNVSSYLNFWYAQRKSNPHLMVGNHRSLPLDDGRLIGAVRKIWTSESIRTKRFSKPPIYQTNIPLHGWRAVSETQKESKWFFYLNGCIVFQILWVSSPGSYDQSWVTTHCCFWEGIWCNREDLHFRSPKTVGFDPTTFDYSATIAWLVVLVGFAPTIVLRH